MVREYSHLLIVVSDGLYGNRDRKERGTNTVIQEMLAKITRIEDISAETIIWQKRSEAFKTWRQVTEARDAALLLSDMKRYRRLCMLSEVAWDRYSRRLNHAA